MLDWKKNPPSAPLKVWREPELISVRDPPVQKQKCTFHYTMECDTTLPVPLAGHMATSFLDAIPSRLSSSSQPEGATTSCTMLHVHPDPELKVRDRLAKSGLHAWPLFRVQLAILLGVCLPRAVLKCPTVFM